MFTTLIDAKTLSQHLNDPQWVILDCRHDLMNPDFGRNAFAEGHIEGAQFANIDTDLSGPKVGADGVFRGRHPLPDRSALIETLRAWGINDDSQVVSYDAHGGMFAARLWWHPGTPPACRCCRQPRHAHTASSPTSHRWCAR
jgi:thiosulfate/3-mercaptopyruvate sulfurtransferase